MKKIPTRLLSVALVFLMLFTMMPLKAFAEDEYTAEAENSVAFEATNTFGQVLSDIAEDETDEQQSTGYFILDVTVEDNIATVDFNASGNSQLIVAIYNEEGTRLITSEKADVNASAEQTEIEFSSDLPEYFLLRAFMLDSNNSPVCQKFESIKYTKAFQEFLEKDTFDFDEEKVISLSTSTQTNFAVVSDNAQVIEQMENENILTVNDFENGIYTFENANNDITSLEEGDVLYFVYGDSAEDYILTKVGSIKNNNGTVTITTADEYEISDFFSYIKIDTEAAQRELEEHSTYNLNRSTNSENNGNSGSGWSVEALTISSEHENGNKEFAVTGGIKKINLGGTANFNFYIKFYYDFQLFGKSHYEFTNILTTKINLSGEISAFGRGELTGKALDLEIPIPAVPGISVSIVLGVTLTIESEVEYSGDMVIVLKNGARRISGSPQEKIAPDPVVEYKFDAEGEVSISFGAFLEIGVEIIKVFSVSGGVEGVFILSGSIEKSITNQEYPVKKHECDKCIDGNVKAELNLLFDVSFGISDKLSINIIDLTYNLREKDLFDFYISLEKDTSDKYKIKEYGKGNCPYIKYRVNVTVLDKEDKPIQNAVITETTKQAVKADGTPAPVEDFVTDESGKAIAYFPVDEHSVRGKHEEFVLDNERMAEPEVDFVIEEVEEEEEYEPIDLTIYMELEPDGQCGDYAYYSIFDDKILYIFGEGDMWDFEFMQSPWYYRRLNFTNVIIDDGLTSIGDFAFLHFNNLEIAVISEDIIKIGHSAFEACNKLTRVIIPNSVESIGRRAFFLCKSLEYLAIPDSVTSIDNQAFTNCINLSYISISNNVKSIGDYAFAGCEKLTRFTIPNSVTCIGTGVLQNCINLTRVTIPSSVISIGDCAFQRCDRLTSVTIPDSVTSIGRSAFAGCLKLTRVTIPSSVTSIGDFAFRDCANLVSVTISDGVTYIGKYAFYWCTNLISVTIPKSVTSIGHYAFEWCVKLISISIPISTTSIGEGFVMDTVVYYPGTRAQWENIAESDYLPHYYVFADESHLPKNNYAVNRLTNTKLTSTDEPNKITQTVNTIPGYNYVIAVVKSDTAEDLLNSSNLLYIDQKKADGETLSFSFTLDENVTDYKVLFFNDETHSHSYEMTEQPATCTEDGLKTFTCSCGDTYTETIAKLPHTFTEKIIDSAHLVSAATTESPAIYKYDCVNCDAISDDLTFTHGDKLTVTKPAKVKTITATQTTSTITLNWSKSEGATGYRVYQYSPSKGKYVVIESLKGKTSYTKSKNLKAGSQYKFKIKPYVKLSDGTVIWGDASDAFTTATKPLAPTKVTATTTKSTISLKWSASAGATGYRVYQYSPSKGKYVMIESLKGKTSYKKSKSLKANSTYKFKIKPYVKLADGTVIWGSASGAFAFKTKAK